MKKIHEMSTRSSWDISWISREDLMNIPWIFHGVRQRALLTEHLSGLRLVALGVFVQSQRAVSTLSPSGRAEK